MAESGRSTDVLKVIVGLILAGSLMLVGCQVTSPELAPQATVAPLDEPQVPMLTASTCHAQGGLPDALCSPGVADPRVTQENIATTICKSGYAASVRPSSSYTNKLKVEQMKAYGLTGSPSLYEEDHVESLEIGGHPTDPKNLFPEAYEPRPGAHEKDTVEGFLHRQICAHLMLLVDAQHGEATDWRQYLGRNQ